MANSTRRRKKDKPMKQRELTPQAGAGFLNAGRSQTTFSQHGYSWCRHDPTLVANCDGVNLYGASKDNIRLSTLPSNVALMALVTFPLDGGNVLTVPSKFMALKAAELQPPPVIRVDWTDGGIPGLKDCYWSILHACLKHEKLDLVTFCFGGHGRTGTALSAYLIANAGLTATKAIETVRKGLCSQCVETERQVEYLYCLAARLGVKGHETDIMPAGKGSYSSKEFSTSLPLANDDVCECGHDVKQHGTIGKRLCFVRECDCDAYQPWLDDDELLKDANRKGYVCPKCEHECTDHGPRGCSWCVCELSEFTYPADETDTKTPEVVKA